MEYETAFPPVKVRRDDGTLSEFKGVSAAIKHVADRVLEENDYAGLPEDDPRMRDLRRAFYRLAKLGEQGQFVRRVALRSRLLESCANPRAFERLLNHFEHERLLASGVNEKGEATVSVAHEALFRVWDRLREWLNLDRKAIALRMQIEDAASAWDLHERAASHQWREERILEAVAEIERSGVPVDAVARPTVVRAFLGPTDPVELEGLPGLSEAEDAPNGSGRYGEAWRLPLSHHARASAGVRLALRGDRRRGVGLRPEGLPDIDWCRVAGGEVTVEVRSDPYDPDSKVVDRLTRSVKSFAVARYPVTIAQFQAFLRDCYRDGRWRLPPGSPVTPRRDDPPPRHRTRYENHPADAVNWWDALAFCHWLGLRLNADVRLPTEFEWQLAATGGDPQRAYPWGRDWDPRREPWRANTSESNLGCSTAVGLYPQGASPVGAQDMAGTLWEWCLNAFDDPTNTRTPSSRGDTRALRGGSWVTLHRGARCTNRNGTDPYFRRGLVGFRVISASAVVGP
jgi:formylglycine-generating enzyme required for sulfatase activity